MEQVFKKASSVIIKKNISEFEVSKWSGGETTQFLIYPHDANYGDRDFLWRISSATVTDSKSVFTHLPDYQRYITTLDNPLLLTANDAAPVRLEPFDVFPFDGAASVCSEGRCTDFNLMLRKEMAQGLVSSVLPTGDFSEISLLPGAEVLLFFLPQGEVTIRIPCAEHGGDEFSLAGGDVLIVENPCFDGIEIQGLHASPLLIAQAKRA